MQPHHEALELCFVLHARCRFDSAVYVDKTRATRTHSLTDVFRVEAARQDPEVMRMRGLVTRELWPVARFA